MLASDRRLFKDLPPVPRAKILGYIQNPSFESWRAVRNIPISHGQTLWDVIETIDFDWPGAYPSMILVARASKVVDRRKEELSALEM